MSSCTWCPARLNILLRAHATLTCSCSPSEVLFLGIGVMSSKAGAITVLLGFLSATSLLLKASTPRSGSWLYIKWIASTKFKSCLLQSEWALSSASQYFSGSLLCHMEHLYGFENLFACLFQVVLHEKSCRFCHSL